MKDKRQINSLENITWSELGKQNIQAGKVYIWPIVLGLGQTSNFSWDEPNLVSYVDEKFDFWLSEVRLNKFGSSNTFYPSASDGYRTSEDRLRDKRRSSRDE